MDRSFLLMMSLAASSGIRVPVREILMDSAEQFQKKVPVFLVDFREGSGFDSRKLFLYDFPGPAALLGQKHTDRTAVGCGGTAFD